MNWYSFLLTFCLAPFFAVSQNAPAKTLFIISPYNSQSNCKTIAFKISNSKIEIDNCYDVDSEAFKSIKTIPLSKEKLMEKIFHMPIAELQQYEKAIDATNCDYGFPIQFIIEEKGELLKIEWKDVQRCYPKSTKKIVKSLRQLFNKYKRGGA